jgi:hypothetical protein
MAQQTSKPRSDNASIADKLAKLEEQKQTLITQRKEQIFDILTQTRAISAQDELIAGAMLFIVNQANVNNPIMQEFRKLTKEHKIKLPSKRR